MNRAFLRPRTALAGILLVAAGLRLWGIDFGLPHRIHADERLVVNNAVAVGMGELRPPRLVIPPVHAGLLAGTFGGLYAVDRATGRHDGVDGFSEEFLTDPTRFYVLARLVLGVVPALATVWMLARLGAACGSRTAGRLAALLLAVCYLHVRDSHFAYADMGTVFLIVLAIERAVRYATAGGRGRAVLAGAAAGLAAGAKYNALLVAVVPLLAWIARSPREGRSLAAGGIAFLAALVLLNPFLLLDPAGVRAELLEEGGKHGATAFLHHATYSLAGGMGIPLLLAGLLGLFFEGGIRRRRWAWIAGTFVLLWYLYVARFALPYARYVLPVVPLLCLGAARFSLAAGDRIRRTVGGSRRAIMPAAVACAVLLAIPSTARAVRFDRILAAGDTRTLAHDWILDRVPDGAVVVQDHTLYGPELPRSRAQLAAKLAEAEETGDATNIRRVQLLRMAGRTPGYTVYHLLESGAEGPLSFFHAPVLPLDPDAIAAAEGEWLVLTGARRNSRTESFYREAEAEWEIVVRLSPWRDGGGDPPGNRIEEAGLPFAPEDLARRVRTGWPIEIRRRREAPPAD